jgi:hypothetical protein
VLFSIAEHLGGGAVATATGEGLPATGFEGCNPTPRSAQQGTGGTPEPTRSAVLFFRGFCLFPRLRGTLKRGFQVGRISRGFLLPGSLSVSGVFDSVVPFLPVPGFPLTNIVPVVSGFCCLRKRKETPIGAFSVFAIPIYKKSLKTRLWAS